MPIEVASAIDRPDDRVQRNRAETELPHVLEAERFDHLLVGKDHPHVVGLAAQAGDQFGHRCAPAGAQEIVLRVNMRHTG